MGFPGGASGKESVCQFRKDKRCSFDPCVVEKKCPGEGHGNSLQYSCLENPVDRGVGGLQSMGSQSDPTE